MTDSNGNSDANKEYQNGYREFVAEHDRTHTPPTGTSLSQAEARDVARRVCAGMTNSELWDAKNNFGNHLGSAAKVALRKEIEERLSNGL